MEKQHYILNLSLKQITLRKVAIIMWHQVDVLLSIKKFHRGSLDDYYDKRKWQKEVEKKVHEKVSMVLLPKSLREELMHVIKPVGPEILKWKMHHENILNSYFSEDTWSRLCWTHVGTVDYRRTAESLIKQKQIDNIKSYKLSCLYCLDDDIRMIWGTLSEENKKCFYNEEDPLYVRQSELVVFWTYILKGETPKLDGLINRNGVQRTLYQYAFEIAVLSGNKAATEYFFQKLTFEEREVSVLKTAQLLVDKRLKGSIMNVISDDFPKQKFCDVLCYLLSQMNEEDQMQVFKKYPYSCLHCFLDWPWQDLFIKVAELMWNFLPEDRYESLILTVASNRTMDRCDYPKRFKELFLLAPSHYRKYIMEKHWRYGFWFRDLFSTNNTECIKLVLRNADSNEKERFITCQNGLDLCWRLINDGKWFLLELFIAECTLSIEAKTRLKELFMENITRFLKEGQIKWRRRIWEKFFNLIESANVNDCNKKCLEDLENEEHPTNKSAKRKRR